MSALDIAQAILGTLILAPLLLAGVRLLQLATLKPSHPRAIHRLQHALATDEVEDAGVLALSDHLSEEPTEEEPIPVRVDFNTISPRQGVH